MAPIKQASPLLGVLFAFLLYSPKSTARNLVETSVKKNTKASGEEDINNYYPLDDYYGDGPSSYGPPGYSNPPPYTYGPPGSYSRVYRRPARDGYYQPYRVRHYPFYRGYYQPDRRSYMRDAMYGDEFGDQYPGGEYFGKVIPGRGWNTKGGFRGYPPRDVKEAKEDSKPHN